MTAYRIVIAASLIAWPAAKARAADDPPTPTAKVSVPAQATTADVPDKLDDMIRTALESNPQIIRAVLQVKAAQAELNQALIAVTQKVTDLYHHRRELANSLDSVKHQMQLLERSETADNTAEVKSSVELLRREFLNAQEQIARVEAEIRATLGVVPGGAVSFSVAGGSISIRLPGQPTYPATPTPPQRPVPVPRPPEPPTAPVAPQATAPADSSTYGAPVDPYAAERSIPEPIAKALEAKVRIDGEEMTLDDVVAILQKATGGELLIVVDEEARKETARVVLHLPREVSVRDAMEILGDVAEITFVIRDYGILVTERIDPQQAPGFILIPDYRRPAGRPLGSTSK